MRVFGTVVLGTLFALAFAAFLLLGSAASYPTSTDAVVATLRAADVRTAALDTLQDVVQREVQRRPEDPVFAQFAVTQTRAIIDRVFPEEWFYATVAQAHRGLIDFLQRGRDTVRIDLTGTKDRLRTLLLDAGRQAVEMCDAVGGGRACRDAARDVQRTLRRYQGQIEQALARVPDTVNLTWLLTMGGLRPGEIERSPELAEVRRLADLLHTVRWVGLAALAVLLGLVALINAGTLPRALRAVGIVLACAAGLYLVAVPAASDALAGRLRDRLAREGAAAVARGDPDYPQIAAGRVVTEAFRRVGHDADGPAAAWLAAGLVLLAAGIAVRVVRRRRLLPPRHSLPPPPPPPGTGPPLPPAYFPPTAP